MPDRRIIKEITLGSEAATLAFATALAPMLRAGDTLLLEGPVGAGKSFFARSVIQARLAALGRSEDVPSPTFTLVQIYDLDNVELWHCDLYRLTDPAEAYELGLDEAFDQAICLVEWPGRLGGLQPEGALRLFLCADAGEDGNPDRRIATLSGSAEWARRLETEE